MHGRTKGIKKERTGLIKETKDRILNVKRATENVRVMCVICANEIKRNHPFRALPKDKNYQEVSLYQLRMGASKRSSDKRIWKDPVIQAIRTP